MHTTFPFFTSPGALVTAFQSILFASSFHYLIMCPQFLFLANMTVKKDSMLISTLVCAGMAKCLLCATSAGYPSFRASHASWESYRQKAYDLHVAYRSIIHSWGTVKDRVIPCNFDHMCKHCVCKIIQPSGVPILVFLLI